MAVDIVSVETITPRLSFSYNINQETKPNESSITNNFLSQPDSNDNNSDFDFPELTLEELSPADELFSQGRIRPLIQLPKPKQQHKTDTLRTLMEESPNRDSSVTKPPLKFFWGGVKRSSSLNCENTHKKTSYFWSLSLLLRSKSTGSVLNSKQSPSSSQKQNSYSHKQGRSQSPSSSFSMYSFTQKSSPNSMKKDYGNGVRVSPVLNLPPNRLSFCSLFGTRISGKYVKENIK